MWNIRKLQKGFSLIELMIAMVLGLVLMAGVIQVFITSKQTFNLNEEMNLIQDNARHAIGFMAEDVRMAGYFGCASRAGSVVNVLKNAGSNWYSDFTKGLQGYDGDAATFPAAWFPRPQTSTLPATMPRTDVFTVHRADLENELKIIGHVPDSAVIDIKGTHDLPTGTILVASDCHHTAIFQNTGNQKNKINHNTGASVSPGNCTKKLSLNVPVICSQLAADYVFKPGSSVMRAMAHAYYVNIAPNGVPSLYRSVLNAGGLSLTAEEMIQGVENMQVEYGLDNNADGIPNRYVLASQVSAAQWEADVVSMRVTLLLRSLTELASEPQSFSYLGVAYTPTDRYVRRVFSTTVKLRNRGV